MTSLKHLIRAVSVLILTTSVSSAEPVKVGIVAPFTGPYAAFGESWKSGIAAFQKINGQSIDGSKIELIYRDLPGPNPGEAKALVQELILKDKVQYVGGIVFTPNAFAIATTIEEAKSPTVIFNAATSSILEKSKYFVRTSYTLPQLTVPVARFMLEQNVKSVVTVVSDYAPGVDAEATFVRTFEASGGKVNSKIRVPLKTTDFGPYMQQAKSSSPQAVFVFFPGGPPSFGIIKAYKDNDLSAAGIRFFGTTEADERDLPAMGDAALGVETGLFYSGSHESAANKAFIDALKSAAPAAIASSYTLAGFDGISVIYKMIQATKGERNPDGAMSAIQGFAWESPRGPVRIDADTRHIIQNVYMRKVEKNSDGKLYHREVKTYEQQPDYGRIQAK